MTELVSKVTKSIQKFFLIFLDLFQDLKIIIKDEKQFNKHFWTAHSSCHPCQMHYNVITRQENSGPDASYFLRKIKAENISYLPGKFLHFIAEK